MDNTNNVTREQLEQRLSELRRALAACGVAGQSNPRLARWLEREIARIKAQLDCEATGKVVSK
jgi:ribosomal protein L29